MSQRLEAMKGAFLVLGILAIGFAIGVWYANARHSCAPPWITANLSTGDTQ